MNIKELVQEAHENAVKHGFWEHKPEIGTSIALIHAELSEALEEERAGRPHVWHECKAPHAGGDDYVCGAKEANHGICLSSTGNCLYRGKPEGLAIELADAVIRIADMCGAYGIDLEAAIEEKMQYNKSRPYKHGKKF